jgi:hypothetical protein
MRRVARGFMDTIRTSTIEGAILHGLPCGLRRKAFTRLDLVVIVMLGTVFFGACSSMIQGSRDAARKSACSNNLKQIGLGLLQYETQFRSFPYGARVQSDAKTGEWLSDWGPSWWLGMAAFSESSGATRSFNYNILQNSLILDKTGNGLILDNVAPGYMQCPASPLPSMVELPSGVKLAAPTYAGISGTVPDLAGIPVRPNWSTDRLPGVPDVNNPPQGPKARCTAQATPEGTLGGSGAFPPNEAITIAQFRDGISNTVMVGEQSDYGIDATAGDRKVDIRSCSWYGAWLGLGNTGEQNIKRVGPELPGTMTAYNCTTIAFPINSKTIRTAASPIGRQMQVTVPGLVGISPETMKIQENPSGLGNNNGIQSAHSGGAFVAFGDGRVTFVSDTMDFRIFLYMSCRDDQRGYVLPEK